MKKSKVTKFGLRKKVKDPKYNEGNQALKEMKVEIGYKMRIGFGSKERYGFIDKLKHRAKTVGKWSYLAIINKTSEGMMGDKYVLRDGTIILTGRTGSFYFSKEPTNLVNK